MLHKKAYESVVQLQRGFTRENLLTISPEGIAGAPYDIFIFDGNEAGGAGIAEMLIQSHEDISFPKGADNVRIQRSTERNHNFITVSLKKGQSLEMNCK